MHSKQVETQFITAYEAHSDAIFRYCYYRVFNRELARDLTQEAFMKTWKSLAAGSEVRNIRAYLYRVAKHLVIDHSRKRREASLDEMSEQGFEPEIEEREAIEIGIDARSAIVHIRRLNDIYREVMLLRFVDGFSPKEISALIGETQNVVSVRINRGLKQLRSSLESEKSV
ncbi:MAG: RNA polymerase sigma factor [Candidatus Magasanikbacteria bacterium GW2011_GWA2_56_11]|uniref:RNA polymerase sigma factor n=1 Tax=Candidatus Magasanikbacteria bacterium GW2011_GWA2_56_11 TaxID=1619044 RepID=A0A0G1YHB3_9BACT|nr:MAG: RNA polymerase sigma factor [Candidatus Magasanikbacteria bacterium GW2011_GWA2_56_11]